MNLEVLKFEVSLNGRAYESDAANDLRIDRTILDEEFANQHTRFAYYGTLHEMAKDRAARLKVSLETLYAQLDHEKRMAANAVKASSPGFKYTEAMCENEVKTDPRYIAKQNELLDANQLMGVLGVAREAFQQRKDMLISLGANARASTPDLRIYGDRVKEETGKKVAKKQAPVVEEPTEGVAHKATTGIAAPATMPRRRPVKTEE